MKIFTAEQIKAAVKLGDLLEPIAQSLLDFSAGKSLGSIAHLEWAHNEVHIKNGYVLGGKYFVVKVATSFPEYTAMPLNGLMMAFDATTGEAAALLQDQGYLTDLRTAVAGAVAARFLAPERIETVGLLGTGMQGHLQPHALRLVRKFERLIIWGRNPDKARALVQKLQAELEDVWVECSAEIQPLVEQSDLLITATASREPLVMADWLHPGIHTTALGGDGEGKVELEPAIFSRAKVFVDSLEANLGRGDLQYAVKAGLGMESVLELGNVLAGKVPGRSNSSEITLAKLVGLGVQDLAAAEVTLKRLMF